MSANDKDLAPVFDKLCGLACFELFKCQGAVGQIYTDDECSSLQEQVETLREDQYLEDMYGTLGRLESEEWM